MTYEVRIRCPFVKRSVNPLEHSTAQDVGSVVCQQRPAKSDGAANDPKRSYL